MKLFLPPDTPRDKAASVARMPSPSSFVSVTPFKPLGRYFLLFLRLFILFLCLSKYVFRLHGLGSRVISMSENEEHCSVKN